MSNKEKLINLMRQHDMHKMLYSTGMDLNEERPDGELIFFGAKDVSFIMEVYNIYTEDGIIDIDQDFHVRMIKENNPAMDFYTKYCPEVLNV